MDNSIGQMDELLFSLHVVDTGNRYVSMGEMNKILKQGLKSGEQIEVVLKPDCWRKPQPSPLGVFIWPCLVSESDLEASIPNSDECRIYKLQLPAPQRKCSPSHFHLVWVKIHSCSWGTETSKGIGYVMQPSETWLCRWLGECRMGPECAGPARGRCCTQTSAASIG